MRTITISPLLNGYLVKVGCKTLAFLSAEALCKELGNYLHNPIEVEEEYLRNAINKEEIAQEAPQAYADTGVSKAKSVQALLSACLGQGIR